jgi:hypothetical protein
VRELYDSGVECSKMGVQTSLHDEELSGLPVVMSDNLRLGWTITDFVHNGFQKCSKMQKTASASHF